jgi:pentatricopeptide repeat protein
MHAGISEEAHCYFEVMQKRYGVTPGHKHFACMMDLLGRGGQINEAIRVIGMMPFQPNIVMWHSILGACQRLCNVELGKWAFQHALQLDRRHAVSFILMCNIYIDALMWTEVEEIEAMRNEASEGFYV